MLHKVIFWMYLINSYIGRDWKTAIKEVCWGHSEIWSDNPMSPCEDILGMSNRQKASGTMQKETCTV